MDRVRGQHEVDKDTGEVEAALNRMYRKARPWADIYVAVMEGMDVFEQKRHVDQPVNPVEMERLPKAKDEEERHEPDWRLPNAAQRRNPAVCRNMEIKDRPERPERDRGCEALENTIPDLIAKSETAGFLHQAHVEP